MKTVYKASIESPEMEGFFDENGKLLDYWYCNDACWRDEYFNGVFKKLGIDIKPIPAKLKKMASRELEKRASND